MITVVNNITPKLKKLIAAIKEPRKPLYQAIGTACQAFTKRTFLTNGANIGETWQPLSPTTILLRRQGQSYKVKIGVTKSGKDKFKKVERGKAGSASVFKMMRLMKGGHSAQLLAIAEGLRGSMKILRDTGSAYGKVSFNTIANGVEWGFPASVNYMKYHQTGGGRLPQRKVLGTSPALERKIKAISIEYWKKHLRFVK